jgi:hypothetical protein
VSKEREEILTELLGYARFERADFSTIRTTADPPLPTSEAEVDAFVKSRTKLYMDTWVIPKIEQLLEHEEKSTPAGRKRAELRCGTCEECREGLQCRDFPEPDADGDLA